MTHIFIKTWLVVSGASLAVAITANYSLAQNVPGVSVSADETLGLEKSILTTDFAQKKTVITGGSQRGTNLFHSFYEFNIGGGESVFFSPDGSIGNVIARITGSNVSSIDGILGVEGGANLFLINPNGVIFGSNAELDLRGSFFASTADSVVFENGFEFSASNPQAPPALLNINLPIGLKFGRTPGSIVNNSGTLTIATGKTIGLIGGGVFFNGGQILAAGARVEIGSVAGDSFVSLSSSSSTWTLGYERVTGFQDIYLLGAAITTADFIESGDIQLWGGKVELVDHTDINALGLGKLGGDISIHASEHLILDSSSISTGIFDLIDYANGTAGNINISTKRLTVANKSLIDVSVDSEAGESGNLKIDATDLIEVFGNSKLTAESFAGEGDAGNIFLKTSRLILRDKGQVKTSSIGFGNGGNIYVEATDLVEIFGSGKDNPESSSLSSESNNPNGGNAGNLFIKTRSLNVSNYGEISVSSVGLGTAGNLEIDADTIVLDNGGLLEAVTQGGKGNISISSEKLILRNNSLITTNATDSADGGNITLDTALLLALSPVGSMGSDIVAKADRGTGGNIVINSQGIFGLEERIAIPGNQSNDIDASSQFGVSGQVQINTANDPNKSLVELPVTVVDPDSLVAQNACKRGSESEFTRSGRGGLPPSLSQDFNSDATQVSLVEPALPDTDKRQARSFEHIESSHPSVSPPVVPAQGWVFNDKGQVVLVADNSVNAGSQRLKTNLVGCPVP